MGGCNINRLEALLHIYGSKTDQPWNA